MTRTAWDMHVVGWKGEGQAAIKREKWSSLLRNSMVEFSVDKMGVQTWLLVWKLGMKNQHWLTFNDLEKTCILMSLVTRGFPQRANNMELVYDYFVVSLNKLLNKQLNHQCIEIPWFSCDVTLMLTILSQHVAGWVMTLCASLCITTDWWTGPLWH